MLRAIVARFARSEAMAVRGACLASALLLTLCAAKAQLRRFDAGLVAGLNFAELSGKGSHAYFGPNVGAITTYRFAKHGQVAMEMLYSQNGEYILPEYYPALSYGKVHLPISRSPCMRTC